MRAYVEKIAGLLLVFGSVFLSGCSTSTYSLESYVDKFSRKNSLVKENDGRRGLGVGLSVRDKKEAYSIFSSNEELSYIASNDVYTINAGDKLDISVFKVPELNKITTVNSKGDISFPLIGRFHVKGLSEHQAEEKLASILGVKYLQNPQVSISIDNAINNNVTLEGSVKKSGIFPLQGNMTLLQSIALADGLTDMADPTKIILFRKSTSKTYLLNLQAIREGKARDPYVKADDRIVVAKSGTRSFIKDASTILGGLVAPIWGLF